MIDLDPAAPGLPHTRTLPNLLPSMRQLPPPARAVPSATIIPFPAPPADRCHTMAAAARAMAERIDCNHMVLLEVATELLELNDLAFAARLAALRSDAEGRSVFGDLLGSLQTALTDFERANRALYVLRARITAGLGTMGGADVA